MSMEESVFMVLSQAVSVRGKVRLIHTILHVLDGLTILRYFNTVGSKEGWTPSTFVSSRSNRHKDEGRSSTQRPEDFMDDEDLADAAEAQALETVQAYSGLGSTERDEKRKALLMDILKPEGDTVGCKLLRKMGWRDGQGLGPKIKRSMRRDEDCSTDGGEEGHHLFAPEDTRMITFSKKNDRKGLGYNRTDTSMAVANNRSNDQPSDDDQPDSFHVKPKKLGERGKKSIRGGIGIGVLNDDGSGDDDPYTMGPRISYNRVVGGDRKKKERTESVGKSQPLQSSNPLLGTKPKFISKKMSHLKSGLRKCHDGRLPIAGFALSIKLDNLIADWETRYPHPTVPQDWEPSKVISATDQRLAKYTSTADMAKASQLDPKARAGILGEQLLPGKSVFDFISSVARDKLAAISGRSTLPAGLGETAPKDYADLQNNGGRYTNLPNLGKDIALAALGRGLGGWMPYADDETKRTRYRVFLEFCAEMRMEPPNRPPDVKIHDWTRELQEFAHAAEVFKPMTGKMASRFTTSSAHAVSSDTSTPNLPPLLSKPLAKPEDPAEAAAKMGMFGPLTRSTQSFYPTRLLCKRFNVPLPSNVQPDAESGQEARSGFSRAGQPDELVSKVAMDQMMQENTSLGKSTALPKGDNTSAVMPLLQHNVQIDVSKNEALEAERAGQEVFKAIFGDDDSDSE